MSAVESILTLDRLRQNVAVKELETAHGQPLSIRKTVSVPNFSQVKYRSAIARSLFVNLYQCSRRIVIYSCVCRLCFNTFNLNNVIIHSCIYICLRVIPMYSVSSSTYLRKTTLKLLFSEIILSLTLLCFHLLQ